MTLCILGTTEPQLKPRHSMLLSAVCPGKIAMGARFEASSEKLEKPGIEPTTPGFQVE